MTVTLYWLRQDLRLKDNPALTDATQHGKVMAVYISDTHQSQSNSLGGASKWWLQQSLTELNLRMDGNLHHLTGDPQQIIDTLIKQHKITRLVWNRLYEPQQIARDKALKSLFRKRGIDVRSFNSFLLWEPWQIGKSDGTPYKVFTPYYRKGCLAAIQPRIPLPVPEKINWFYDASNDQGLDALSLMPKINWYHQMEQQWQPGEPGASQHLSAFLKQHINHYKHERDIPSVTGTSRLSPHLHFGEISPHQIWYASLDAHEGATGDPDLDCYLSELGWREFSYYLLYHFPDLPTQNFNSKFNSFQWRHDPQQLVAWQRGQTGIPIIDAGMRELWNTGFMHNRVRMIVASFLVKNLLIDWRHGAQWFWDCLLDADLAANSASWQWVAGCGADAAPYFRIFNPVLQGEKFDKQGDYVRQYCPELCALPDKYIHAPWRAPESILEKANVSLGTNYPHPLVDLKQSRTEALAAFSSLKAG